MPKFREITGQFVGYVPDSIDSDIVPDRAPMNGRVTFTPVFTGGVIAFPELVPPEFAHPRTIPAKIVDGFVRVEVNEGTGDDVEAVLQPLTLMVTVDDEASQVWSWRAEFDEILIGASDEYVKIPAWSFRVPDGTGPVDLTELVPLKTGGSVDVTKGPRGAGLQTITAQNGELVFEYTDGEQATIAIPEAVQGPQGEPGPAGADGEQGPEGPQGPAGEIPDLLVGNITDATPTGKNLMLAATEGAARDALGLQTGATAIAGAYSELENGTQTNSRVWSPKNISDYVEERAQEIADTAKTVVNVKDYGAVGDGTTDDTAAFQAAVDTIKTVGGGNLYIPPAEYQISGHVQLCSNIDVTGYGAVLVKRHNIATSSYAYFSALSEGNTGFGSGGENISVRGIKFTGDFLNNKTTCGFALHHARNVLVEQCEFYQCQGDGHCLDLAACDGVIIRSCVFTGFREAAAGSGLRRTECIQLDASVLGTPSVADSPGSYDGLITRNVTIERCQFLPLTIGATSYPAPNPLGNHVVVEGRRAENVVFRNNTVGALTTDTTSGWRGGIHFPGVKNLLIEGNTFNNSGSNSRVIGLYVEDVGRPSGSDMGATLPGGTVSIEPVGVDDVVIRGNEFVQSTAVASSIQEVIHVDGTPGVSNNTKATRATNVTVEGNSFRLSTVWGETMHLEGVESVSVSGNRGTGVHMAVVVRVADGVRVSGNTWKCSPRTAQTIDGTVCESYRWASGLVVDGEVIRNPLHQAVWVGDSSVDVTVQNVTASDPSQISSTERQMISMASVNRFVVRDCRLTSAASGDRVINAYAPSANGLIADNMTSGYGTAATNGGVASIVLRDNRVL